MSAQSKSIMGGFAFLLVIAMGTYLLFDLEALTEKELAFIDQLEGDVARALDEKQRNFFPKAGRLPSKFQMGGTPPAVYKLKITTGRRGRRLTFDLSIKSTAKKAGGKFEGRWKHELRANRLGRLEPVELKQLEPTKHRLAQIRNGRGQVSGLFFLAHCNRGIFGLTLKGIHLSEFENFENMIRPTLKSIEVNGPTIMID
jgi:hypothetical protein